MSLLSFSLLPQHKGKDMLPWLHPQEMDPLTFGKEMNQIIDKAYFFLNSGHNSECFTQPSFLPLLSWM